VPEELKINNIQYILASSTKRWHFLLTRHDAEQPKSQPVCFAWFGGDVNDQTGISFLMLMVI